MDVIIWSSSLEIGVKAIDAEHKHLIEFIHLVRAASEKQRSTLNSNKKFLNDLKILFMAHFEKEEDLMFQIGYPGVNAHMILHSAMQGDFDTRILETEQTGDVECALSFVATWIIDHMATADTSLAGFIQQKRDAKAQARAKRAETVPKTARELAHAIAAKARR